MSVLVSMEGCLSDDPHPPWDSISREEIFSLLHMVFNTATVAMRFEPANAKFFHQEVGCFIFAFGLNFSDFNFLS